MTARKGSTRSPYGAAGAALWTSVMDAYKLDPAETAILAQACRTLDELARIDTELVTSPLMVTGSMGQPVPNPLLAEARAHRKVLESLARSLALPINSEQSGTVRHPQQRAAVKSRHRGAALRSVRRSADGPA
jgi:hypothetical protein